MEGITNQSGETNANEARREATSAIRSETGADCGGRRFGILRNAATTQRE